MRIVSHQILQALQSKPACTLSCEFASTEGRSRRFAVNASWPTPWFAGNVVKMLVCVVFVSTAWVPEAFAQVAVPQLAAPPIVSVPSPQLENPQISEPGVPILPTLSPFNTFPDRVNACIQMGSAAGLSSGSLDAYIGQCANQ